MRKLAIAVALSSTVLSTPAFARDGAFYVGADFGPMIVEDVEFDVAGRNNAIIANHRYGFDGSAFVGYDLGAFRLEAEVGYKRARLDTIESTIGLPGVVAPGALGQPAVQSFRTAGGGETSALSFMVNGMLDFGEDDGISGFIGGGAGIARVDFDNQRAFENQGAFIDDSDTRFAWQVLAGVRQAVTPNMDVTVRYRFFNVPDLDVVGFGGRAFTTRFRSHSLMGGITFNFGTPPVVVPDVVVPAPIPAPPPPQMQTCPNGQQIPVTEQCPPAPIVGPFIVFFDWDRADITPQAAAILDNAAQQYQTTGQAQVVLAGHADRSGSAEYNVGLSQRRADNVRQYLAGRGVPEGVMRTEAFGESRPLVETADGVREPQNRRVEITMGPGAGQ